MSLERADAEPCVAKAISEMIVCGKVSIFCFHGDIVAMLGGGERSFE